MTKTIQNDPQAIISELVELLKSAEHELEEWVSSYPGQSDNTPVVLELIANGLKMVEG